MIEDHFKIIYNLYINPFYTQIQHSSTQNSLQKIEIELQNLLITNQSASKTAKRYIETCCLLHQRFLHPFSAMLFLSTKQVPEIMRNKIYV